jgi:hypothetical protein
VIGGNAPLTWFALSAMEGQRELAFKAELASVAAQRRRIGTETAPVRYVPELSAPTPAANALSGRNACGPAMTGNRRPSKQVLPRDNGRFKAHLKQSSR